MSGLDKTLQVLRHTDNESAIGVLATALTSGDAAIRQSALRGLLTRREEAAHQQVLRHWPDFDEECKTAAAEFPGRLFTPVRDEVTSGDAARAEVACDAALWTSDYDLAPVLAMLANDESDPCAELAAGTLLQLTEKLFEASQGPRDYRDRRDPRLIRARVCSNLEGALAQRQLRRVEAIESFLQLCQPDAPGLKRILRTDAGPRRQMALQVFRSSCRPGVLHLLMDLFDDAHTPLVVAGMICEREDRAFLTTLFHRAADGPSPHLKRNLKRITSARWVGEDLTWLDSLDGRGQRGAIEMVLASAIPRDDAFRVIAHLGQHGTQDGRRAAAKALQGFPGSEANQLVLRVLDDESPAVQAEALAELRDRRLPGALPRLIELLDSSHDAVRDKARGCLSEFTLPRFLAAFDLLDEDVQQSTGPLVRRVDPDATKALIKELKADVRERRCRALTVAEAMGALDDVETHVVALMNDRDAVVRAAAAATLAKCNSADAKAALRQALVDENLKVRQAAESSLQADLPDPNSLDPCLASDTAAPFATPATSPALDGGACGTLTEEPA